MVATGHSVLFGFWGHLASHLGRSPFHPCSAFPLRRMVRGCPSCATHSCFAWKPRVRLPWRTRSPGRWSTGPSAVSGSPLDNPFGGVKVHWTFTEFRLTHSPARLKRAIDQAALPESPKSPTKSPGAILNSGAKRRWPRRGAGQDARSNPGERRGLQVFPTHEKPRTTGHHSG